MESFNAKASTQKQYFNLNTLHLTDDFMIEFLIVYSYPFQPLLYSNDVDTPHQIQPAKCHFKPTIPLPFH